MSGHTLTTVYTESSMPNTKSCGKNTEDMLWVLWAGAGAGTGAGVSRVL